MRRSLSVFALLLGAALLIQAPVLAEEPKAVEPKDGAYEVQVVKDVGYYTGKDADKVRHSMSLYLPKGAKGYPVFLFIHGGGWTKGSNAGFAKHGDLFARSGVGFVAMNYRLTKHPEHIEDVARAFAWVHQNIAKHGGDPTLIFVGGHSAGGHLAALLATDEKYLKEHKLGLSNIKGVIPISGVFRVGGGKGGKGGMNKIFGDAESSKAASPITHVSTRTPPMLILYASKEIAGLGKQAEAFAEVMRKEKGTVRVMMIEDRDHGTIMRNIANAKDPATVAIFNFLSMQSGRRLVPLAGSEAKSGSP
jgi:acetyl esterase/lipase